MRYTADYLIQKRKEKWNELQSIEYDKEFRDAVVDELLDNAELLAEIIRNPEKLVELTFIVVDKNQKTMPFFFNDVQQDFIDTLNQAIENIATPVTPRDVLADTEPTLSEVSTEEKTESVATETAVEEKTPEASAVSVENTTHRRIKMLGRCERFERPLRVGCVGADVEKMKKALCANSSRL